MKFIPATGPWFKTYRVFGPETFGVMLSTGARDIALSGAALGHGLVVGWRCRTRTFRDRRVALGSER